MSFFKQIEGEAAILVNGGVYTQVDLYTRDGYLFAKHGAGWVRLMADGSTSKPKVYCEFLTYSRPLAQRLGRLCEASVDGAKVLSGPVEKRLLGGAK